MLERQAMLTPDAAMSAEPDEFGPLPSKEQLHKELPYAFWPVDAQLPEGAKRPTFAEIRKAYPRLCLEPCCVPTRNHPGMCIGEDGDPTPVCTALRGHPGGLHFCVPSDAGLWAECPNCKQIVAKRALKGHIAAHEDERTPEQRERDNRRTVREACRVFLEQHAGWGADATSIGAARATYRTAAVHYTARGLLERYLNYFSDDLKHTGDFWKRSLKTSVKTLGIQAPPVDVPQARKLLGLKTGDRWNGIETSRGDASTPLTVTVGEPLVDPNAEARAERARQWAERDQAATTAGHLGQPGERLELEAQLAYAKGIERNRFGERWLVTFIVTSGPHEGAVLKWWTDAEPRAPKNMKAPAMNPHARELTKEHGPVKIRATVKQHGSFKNVPETTITRVQIIGPADPAAIATVITAHQRALRFINSKRHRLNPAALEVVDYHKCPNCKHAVLHLSDGSQEHKCTEAKA